jgi:hypothetical protein
LNRYIFRKPKRKASLNEQISPISISNSEENKQKEDLQQEQGGPLHRKEPT